MTCTTTTRTARSPRKTSSSATVVARTCARSTPAAGAARCASTTSSPRTRRPSGRRSRLRDAGGQTAVLRPADAVGAEDVPKVYLSVPRTFNDAQPIGDRYKRGIPVIINLQTVEAGLAKRLIDFASGLTYALEGRMQRIADKVFLLTPENVELSAEDQARYLDAGFFNQAVDLHADAGGVERRGRERPRRHRHPGDVRHAGPAAGQAAVRPRVRRRHRRARRRGLQLPARGRRRHEHRAGLRDVVVGGRLRRLRLHARPRDAAAHPVARGHGDGAVRPAVARRLARGGLAAAGAAPSARADRRARLARLCRLRARVHPLRRDLRLGAREGLARAAARECLQRRLLDPRDDDGRAGAARDPPRHGGRGHASSRTPRASAISGSTRSTSATRKRCGWPTTTSSTATARRRSRSCRARRSRSCPSTTSARATRATST